MSSGSTLTDGEKAIDGSSSSSSSSATAAAQSPPFLFPKDENAEDDATSLLPELLFPVVTPPPTSFPSIAALSDYFASHPRQLVVGRYNGELYRALKARKGITTPGKCLMHIQRIRFDERVEK